MDRRKLLAIATITFLSNLGWHLGWASENPVADPQTFAVQKLRDAGASDAFIKLVTGLAAGADRDRIIELNVLGFLGHGDYNGHYSAKALRRCRTFIQKNKTSLQRAQKDFAVSKEVLTALLWVETKHGRTLGNTNVPQVYFSLLQADHPLVLKSTLDSLEIKVPNTPEELKAKARKRSEDKAGWALTQLQALEEIYKRSAKRVSSLNGSFAGAFGIPQFIPTSYLRWAKTRRKPANPNLFQMDDAIQSAAFYLHSNGWDEHNSDSKRGALFHYNKSRDYVEVILKIADALKETPPSLPRSIAGKKTK